MRLYAIPWTGTLAAASGDIDLLELLPATQMPCALVGYSLGQTSELGDAAEESLRITIRRLTPTVTGGSGGSAVTPVPLDGNDAAAGFAAACGNSTVATSSGTDTIIEEHAWNVRNTPYERWIPEEQRPRAQNAEALVVRLESTVDDDITVALTFWAAEL
jgi:hypothetical protein